MNTTIATATRPEVRSGAGKPLYSVEASFREIVPIGPVADGFRLDGHFAGVVTAGDLTGAEVTGVDYFRIRHDGVGIVRAHEIVRLDEAVVAVELHGYLLPPDGIEAPTPTDIIRPGFTWPDEPYTIHVGATFETAAPQLAHLNRTVVAHEGFVNFTSGQLTIDAYVVG